jgi:hypothetical protein
MRPWLRASRSSKRTLTRRSALDGHAQDAEGEPRGRHAHRHGPAIGRAARRPRRPLRPFGPLHPGFARRPLRPLRPLRTLNASLASRPLRTRRTRRARRALGPAASEHQKHGDQRLPEMTAHRRSHQKHHPPRGRVHTSNDRDFHHARTASRTAKHVHRTSCAGLCKPWTLIRHPRVERRVDSVVGYEPASRFVRRARRSVRTLCGEPRAGALTPRC